MTFKNSKLSFSYSERGSSLFIILIIVALVAALSYALSQQRGSGEALSSEKVRILASDVIDMGNSLADAASRLKLHNVTDTEISFENTTVTGYANASCTDDSCKIFAYDGGGKTWEIPSREINTATSWGFIGNLAVKNIGSSSADLMAILPSVSENICRKINVMLGIHDNASTPTVIASLTVNKFSGAYAAVPNVLTSSQIDGQKSGCVKITTLTGTAVENATYTNNYVFYQILSAR